MSVKPEVTERHKEAAARVLDPCASNPLVDRIALAIAYAEIRGAAVSKDFGVTSESPQVSTKLSTHVRPYIEDIRKHMEEIGTPVDGLAYHNADLDRERAKLIADEFERLVMLLASGKCYE